jgi:integrase
MNIAVRRKERRFRTVNEIFDRYIDEVLPELAEYTRRDYLRIIKILRGYFGTKIASSLVPADFQEFMSVSAGKARRNDMLKVLSSVFSRAEREWQWLDHNVCYSVRRHKTKKRQSRNVSDEDIRGVLSMASATVQNFLKLSLMTGRKQEDILGLRWSQVNPKEILFRDPGKRQKVSVAITPELQAVLDNCRVRSGKSEYVITTAARTKHGKPYTGYGIRALWQRTMREWEASGNNRFTFFDVRAKASKQLARPPVPFVSEGVFISAGAVLDAYTAIGKLLSTAKVDLLIVDPYMDEKAVTEFSPLVNSGVSIRLLADAQHRKATLAPAAIRWAAQYGPGHPLEVRLAPARSLHDRLVAIDDKEVWILTQSLNAFAARAPASIVRVDPETADLKLAAYKGLWQGAQLI